MAGKIDGGFRGPIPGSREVPSMGGFSYVAAGGGPERSSGGNVRSNVVTGSIGGTEVGLFGDRVISKADAA